MKMLKLQNFKQIRNLTSVVILFISLGFSQNLFAQDGEALFNANCASCHKPDEDFVGPALKGAKGRWEENSSMENFYAWVKNSQAVISSGDPYANKLFSDWNESQMTANAVTNEEIDAIFEYVESYTPPVAEANTDTGGAEAGTDEEGSTSWLWWVLAALFLVVTFSLVSVRRQLVSANNEKEGLPPLDKDQSYFEILRGWAWKNRVFVGVGGFVVMIFVLVQIIWVLMGVGVQEGYKPTQPINFSHKVHAGDNEINCVYCHNSVEKSRTAGIPTVNVCMNCHKGISQGKQTGTEEIAKIYAAAGFDPSSLKYSGETTPIKWVKVHNLPDHVYFNHSQHVKVGKIDCKQCHGDMTKETVARVMTVSELNQVKDNIKLSRPTLTMGWCIECHGEKDIDISSQNATDYYKEIHRRLLKDKELYQKYLEEDDKITVKDLGGWECAKCHY